MIASCMCKFIFFVFVFSCMFSETKVGVQFEAEQRDYRQALSKKV